MLSKTVLLVLVISLAFMKPSIHYPVVATDIIFLILLVLLVIDLIRRKVLFCWQGEYWIAIGYFLCLFASLPTSQSLAQSAFKLTSQLYLVSLAMVTSTLINSESDLRRALLAWLSGTAVIALLALASIVTFFFDPKNALVEFSKAHIGTLPPGHYRRLAITFFNPNMLCNYLTVSLGILLIAWRGEWLSSRAAVVLLVGIGIAAVSTISPGLGGILLTLGLWIWLVKRVEWPIRARLALTSGISAAFLFTVALAVTPFVHPTAPFLLQVAGTDIILAPAVRFMAWSEAASEFVRNPLLGHGMGIHAVRVRYIDPSGGLQVLRDAHNVFLNIAAQAGVVGVAGLTLLVGYVVRLSWPWRLADRGVEVARLGLAIGWLNAFVYQGLGGSFEDARHLWVTLGLLLAAVKLKNSAEGEPQVATR